MRMFEISIGIMNHATVGVDVIYNPNSAETRMEITSPDGVCDFRTVDDTMSQDQVWSQVIDILNGFGICVNIDDDEAVSQVQAIVRYVRGILFACTVVLANEKGASARRIYAPWLLCKGPDALRCKEERLNNSCKSAM